MAGDVRVIEDGIEQSPPRGRKTSPWTWLTVGVVVGLGIGAVLFTPTSSGDPASPGTPTAPTAPVPEGEMGSVGVADEVPGFPDALVGVVRDDGGSLAHFLWPVSGDPVIRALPGGDTGETQFDSSGTWLAMTTHVPDLDGAVLSVGKPASVQPLASGVTSFSWHDSEPGILAYTQVVDGVWQMQAVGGDRKPRTIISGEDRGGLLLAWGDWGWAVANPPGGDGVWLLKPSGEMKANPAGEVLDSHPSGWLLMADDGLSLVSAGGGVRRLDSSVDPDAPILNGTISPDGDRIAALTSDQVHIFRVDGTGDLVGSPGFWFGAWRLAWSSDSRFVMMAGGRGVTVFDAESGEQDYVLNQRSFRALSVIPLPRS